MYYGLSESFVWLEELFEMMIQAPVRARDFYCDKKGLVT